MNWNEFFFAVFLIGFFGLMIWGLIYRRRPAKGNWLKLPRLDLPGFFDSLRKIRFK
jgi:hypothetical protein